MVKFPEATNRLIKNIFICRQCKSKIRSTNMKILAGKVRCRKCHRQALRPIRKR